MPVSISGTNGVTFPDSSLQAAAASPYVLKNRIINGDMRIDQRNAGASVTPTDGQYTLDRWVGFRSQASKYSIQQNAGSVTPPTGFTNYLGATSLSSYSSLASDYFGIVQYIEGYNVADLAWGTADAKTITISFWARSSITGTFSVSLRNSAGDRSYLATYTISSANTWTYCSITIPGDTTGTWLTTTGRGIRVWFDLGSGSDITGTPGSWSATSYVKATGGTSVVGTNGATFYITGVQLELGSTATPFERRLYNQELANCQRYYFQTGKESADNNFASGFSGNASIQYVNYYLKQKMRAIPTLSTSGTATHYQIFIGTGSVILSSVPVLDAANSTTDLVLITNTTSGGLTVGQGGIFRANNSTAAFLGFSAEL